MGKLWSTVKAIAETRLGSRHDHASRILLPVQHEQHMRFLCTAPVLIFGALVPTSPRRRDRSSSPCRYDALTGDERSPSTPSARMPPRRQRDVQRATRDRQALAQLFDRGYELGRWRQTRREPQPHRSLEVARSRLPAAGHSPTTADLGCPQIRGQVLSSHGSDHRQPASCLGFVIV